MATPPTQRPSGRPTRKRWVRRVGFALAALFVVGLIVVSRQWIVAVEIPASRLPATLAVLEARGETISLADFAPPPVPDEENAAVLLEKAFAELDRLEAAEQAIVDRLQVEANRARRFEEVTHPYWAAYDAWRLANPEGELTVFRRHEQDLRAYLDSRASALALAEEALRRPGCRFDLPYTDARAMAADVRPYLPGLRYLGRLFELRAFVRTVDGDSDAALEDCGRILQLARLLRRTPLLSHYFARCSLDDRTIERTEYVLNTGRPSTAARLALASSLANEAEQFDLLAVLRGERAYLCERQRQIWLEPPAPEILETLPPESRELYLRRAERDRQSFFRQRSFAASQQEALAATTAIIDAASLPREQAGPALRTAFARYTEPRGRLSRGITAMTGMVLPTWQGIIENNAYHLARLRTGAVGMQLASGLIDRTDTTKSLTASPASLRTDPFTEVDLLLRRDCDTLVIYSVGPNLQDDCGVNEARNPDGDPAVKDDIAFWIPVRREEAPE